MTDDRTKQLIEALLAWEAAVEAPKSPEDVALFKALRTYKGDRPGWSVAEAHASLDLRLAAMLTEIEAQPPRTIPRDCRILVWLSPQWSDFSGEESGWFTAQFDGEFGWRIGLDRIEGCSCVPEEAIVAWQLTPATPAVVIEEEWRKAGRKGSQSLR